MFDMTSTLEPAPDRRVRRSRRVLQQALVDLVLERGWSSVTVEQIIDRADVSRATFYAHYASKDLLLEAVMTELWKGLGREAGVLGPVDTTVLRGAVLGVIFQHAAEHRDLYRLVCSGAADGRPLRTFSTVMAQLIRAGFDTRAVNLGITPRQPTEFLARMLTAEVVAALTWWLEDPQAPGADDLMVMILNRSVHGESWAHGFPPGVLSVDEDAVRAILRAP
jgi:AcrR family transcriptional regulator